MKPPSKRQLRSSVPAGEIATTLDGRDITRGFFRGLQQPRDPRLLGSVDWGVYDAVLSDDQVYSCLQQRRRAVIAHNWHVLPGDDADPRSVAAAEALDNTLKRIGWDRITDRMLYGIFYGLSAAEIIWAPIDGLIDFAQIRVRHARRFRFDDRNRLKLITRTSPMGEDLPDRKFWLMTSGGSDDDELYGRGLAEWLYWPTVFKRNGLAFWNKFLDKWASPTVKGTYRPGTPQPDVQKLLAALQAVSTDTGVVTPEGMAIELLEVARSGTADYENLCRYMDEAIAKVVLSQTMTTQDGSSLSQAQVHADVKLDVVKADADLLSDSFNAGPARWWTDLNFGTDVASPLVMREVEEEADLASIASTDGALDALGWRRTDESFQDVYGDGFERKPEPAAMPAEMIDPRRGNAAAANDDNDNDDEADNAADGPPARAAEFAASDPRPLYVYRRLMNAGDLIDWARAQGFRSTLDPDDLHVTIAYSRRPVNWLKMGGFWGWTEHNAEHIVPPGGPRLVDRLGDQGAVVLHFFSGHLEQRNREMRDQGASWDFPAYLPHVTISYDAGDIDLARVEPYRGRLVFGPEIFEPLEEDWSAHIRETSFAEPVGEDELDGLVDLLMTETGYRAADALTGTLVDRVGVAGSADEVRRILDQEGLTLLDERLLGQSLENAGFALALDAESREGDQ